METIVSFAQFRYQQFMRFLAEIGVFRVLVLVVVGAIGLKFIAQQKEYSAIILIVLNVFIVFQNHTTRKDIPFLKATKPKTFKLLLISEYATISFVFGILAVAFQANFISLIHLVLPAIAFIPIIRNKKVEKQRRNWFLWAPLESRKYLQQHWILLLLAQVLSIIFYHQIAVQIGSTILLLAVYLGKFKAFEGKEMLLSEDLPFNKLLHKKLLKNTLILVASICIPILVIAWQLQLPLVALALLAISALLSIEINYLKYQFYTPGDELDDTVFSVQAGLIIVSSLLPFLLPFALFLVLRARSKALTNLNQYASNYK